MFPAPRIADHSSSRIVRPIWQSPSRTGRCFYEIHTILHLPIRTKSHPRPLPATSNAIVGVGVDNRCHTFPLTATQRTQAAREISELRSERQKGQATQRERVAMALRLVPSARASLTIGGGPGVSR